MFRFRDFNVLSVLQGSMIVTGLVTSVKLVRTFADLTYPSFPRKTLITLPTYHFPRWTFSSAINTRSPIAKLRRGFIHFALSCSVDTYSNSQPVQNLPEYVGHVLNLYKLLQRRLLYLWLSSEPKDPTGKLGFALNNNKWFGVSGSSCFGSLLTGVNGLLFKIPETSAMKVCSISS